jgi:hypothetical protein
MKSDQIQSRERVRAHGEVYTGEREVEAMIGLVEQEVARIESLFLEPACGTGNFLIPILRKKLNVVTNGYKKSQLKWERNAIIAVGSLYGVELLPDNADTCRARLFWAFDEIYTALYKKKARSEMRDAVKFILGRNIIVGDALSLKTVGENPEPIVFSKWTRPHNDSRVKRHDYLFEELIPNDQKDRSLFSDMPLSDMGKPTFIPQSVKEYPLVLFTKLPYATD